MTPFEKTELELLRALELNLRQAQETLLMDIVPDNCNCGNGKTKKVFRCPEAFQINHQLQQISALRNKGQ